MFIKEISEKNRNYTIERRRFYHSYPELTLQEVETAKSIIKDLNELGIESTSLENGYYGCVGIIRGGKPGKTVALRADIDGLPVKEETGLDFTSKNEGKMHACGHDAHIAMLLGAAKVLNEIKDKLCGNVKLIFQPAEELAVGAKEVIRQGFLDDVNACYGIHIWSNIDAPKINMEYGERMGSLDLCTITINGYGAHGSAPHLGKDAIVAASAVLMGIQSIVSRVNNPLNPLVITIGKVDGGKMYNILADKVVMDVGVRVFNKKLRMEVEGYMRHVIENVSKAYGCEGILEYNYVTGSVINSEKHLVDIARNAVIKLYGEDALISMEKVTGAEDFSFYQEKVPGVYGFIGARSEEVPGSEFNNHHECFTVDERSLERGVAVAAQFAYDFLNEDEGK
ncbi:MAG: amidohydrolase [Fusobacteriaceae bacterium]|jgi:amidohydrolase|nr:amidohydrolase [Fusobacteriaceae bacterium]